MVSIVEVWVGKDLPSERYLKWNIASASLSSRPST